MTPRHRLNRFLEAIAIPHLALYVVVGQAFVYLLAQTKPELVMALPLIPERVMAGEWWRLVSYFFVPPSLGSIVANFFTWMLLYFVGSALEGHWGTVKLNLYLGLGWLLTTVAAFVFPVQLVVSYYVILSTFLAFAFIAPELEMMVFFILPVKVKWLALIQWFWYALDFARGPLEIRLSVAGAVGTFLVFFGRDILWRIRGGGRRLAHNHRMRASEPPADAPRHTCRICGKNSNTHPDLDFRYCSKCAGEQCYCPEHIRNHEHVLVDPGEKPSS